MFVSGGNIFFDKENVFVRFVEFISGGDIIGIIINDNVVKGGVSRNRYIDDIGFNGIIVVVSDGFGSLSSLGSVGWVGNIFVENGVLDVYIVVVLFEGDLIRVSWVVR